MFLTKLMLTINHQIIIMIREQQIVRINSSKYFETIHLIKISETICVQDWSGQATYSPENKLSWPVIDLLNESSNRSKIPF